MGALFISIFRDTISPLTSLKAVLGTEFKRLTEPFLYRSISLPQLIRVLTHIQQAIFFFRALHEARLTQLLHEI
jgi:hypothetical protein